MILDIDLYLLFGRECLNDWSDKQSASINIRHKYFKQYFFIRIVLDRCAGLHNLSDLQSRQVYLILTDWKISSSNLASIVQIDLACWYLPRDYLTADVVLFFVSFAIVVQSLWFIYDACF